MEFTNTLLGIALYSGMHMAVSCIPVVLSLAIGKRKGSIGALMLWTAAIGVLLVPLSGSMGIPTMHKAVYGCYLMTILAVGVHVPRPYDRYVMAIWIILPIILFAALALFLSSQL